MYAQPSQKATLTDDNFLDLFFKHKQKVIDTFNWIVDKFPIQYQPDANPRDKQVSLTLFYACLDADAEDKTKVAKTAAFNEGKTRIWGTHASYPKYSYAFWIDFLSAVTRDSSAKQRAQKLLVGGHQPSSWNREFFWDKFYSAYLYFLAMTKMDPQADNTFFTFLDNLKITEIISFKRYLRSVQKQWGWLEALPGVSFSSFDDENSDLTLLFNQDLNTLNLDTFPLAKYRKYFLDFGSIMTFRSETHDSKGNPLEITKPHITLIDTFLDVLKQEGFWAQLQTVLSNPWGIKSLFFNNQEYSLENLANTLPQSGYILVDSNPNSRTPVWGQNFNGLTHAAIAELIKIIFGNSSDTAQGVDSVAKLEQHFQATKRKLLTPLKTALDRIVSLNSTITQLTIKGKPYDLNHLITAKDQIFEDDFATKHQQAFAQAKELVDDQITSNQIKTEFDKLNNEQLDNLWTTLKRESNLGGYTGFNPGDTDFTIESNPYRINLLITNKELETAGRALTLAQGKTQLQALVNAGITASQVRSTLDNANNKKLDDLWTELRPKLIQYANLSSYQITIGSGDNAKVYSLDQLFQDREETTGSNLPNGKSQLQTLVNDGVSVQQITTQLDNLVAKAEKDEAESKKKQNLAIGLGTAGGVVALAGASGFAYWFLKIRKS